MYGGVRERRGERGAEEKDWYDGATTILRRGDGLAVLQSSEKTEDGTGGERGGETKGSSDNDRATATHRPADGHATLQPCEKGRRGGERMRKLVQVRKGREKKVVNLIYIGTRRPPFCSCSIRRRARSSYPPVTLWGK